MFPDSQNEPATILQHQGLPPITPSVVFDLLCPPLAVRLRREEMVRTTVPIAPIDKHADALRGKDDICRDSEIIGRTTVLPKAKSLSKENATKCNFRLGVSPWDGLHRPTHSS